MQRKCAIPTAPNDDVCFSARAAAPSSASHTKLLGICTHAPHRSITISLSFSFSPPHVPRQVEARKPSWLPLQSKPERHASHDQPRVSDEVGNVKVDCAQLPPPPPLLLLHKGRLLAVITIAAIMIVIAQHQICCRRCALLLGIIQPCVSRQQTRYIDSM